MAGREVFPVVECYGTEVLTSENSETEINVPFYRVRGRSFTRTIFRPTEGFDLLLGQVRDEAPMYEFSPYLPLDALENRENLHQCILEYPPPENIRVIPDQFNNLGWNWYHTATVLSDYVHDVVFNNNIPFAVEGDEAFGTVTLMRQDNRWRRESWRLNAPEPMLSRECTICGDPLTYTPIDYLLGLQSQLGRFDGHPLVCGFFKSGSTCMAGARCPFAHKVPRVFDSRTGLDNPKTVELLARNVYMGAVDPPIDQTLKTLYLRRLNSSVHEQHIRDRFSPYGEI
ncbi:unnamed protein product [Brassica oleracea]